MQEDFRLIRALRRLPVDRTPVWIMRQAGRYLPEYRRVREQAGDFLTLCKTPELACEVTLQPLARYDLDAAIIFSDILTIPDAMGLGLQLIEKVGPRFDKAVRSQQDIAQLPMLEVNDELKYVFDAIRLVKQALPKQTPLLGFSGSPWTLACYMVEGAVSKDFAHIKGLLYQSPEDCAQLIQVLSENIINYLLAQVEAGVDALMIFDTWGGILTPHDYRRYSLAPMQMIIDAIKQVTDIPIIIFSKNASQHLVEMANSGCDGISIDWTYDIGQARQQVGHQVALQGNLDPYALLGSDDFIQQEVKRILQSYGSGSGHVFNLGHGITPSIDPDKLAVAIEAVKQLSPQYHQACQIV